jgi:hypothetical protein
MATNSRRGLAWGLERAKVGFAAWRQTRRGAERIPDGLWEEAARAARQHGIHRVSRELGLDYNQLKRRCGGVALNGGATTASTGSVGCAAGNPSEKRTCVPFPRRLPTSSWTRPRTPVRCRR